MTAAIELDRRRRSAQREKSEMEQRFSALTRRERQVMSHVVSGLMNKQIAGELGLAEITVKGHRRKLMTKLGARSVADLVKMSFGLGPDSLAGDQRADAAGSPPDRSGAPGSRDRLNRTPFQTARQSGSAPSDRAAAARL
ncbi:LuxR family transcriptional regulator [Stappia sp. 22II-S9-Z10]|nr:LuxR family transcriptional regulator [Stappia sp. 22II-S9-Z10]